jgi:hypothetical protein
MIRRVTGDDIFIERESFHPMYGSVSKKEAQKKAEECRKKKTCFGARVLKRERGMYCKVGGPREPVTGAPRWVPFRGWVVFERHW